MTKRKIVKPVKKKDPAADKPEKKTRGGVEKTGAQGDNLVVNGIWGLVYLAIGVMLLISLLFFSQKQLVGGSDVHVLGPYFGTSMALGLIYIFGHVTAFVFSLTVCYIGAAKLMNRPRRYKLLLFVAILMTELCLLFAIKYMPELAKPIVEGGGLKAVANAVGLNYIGLLAINALAPLFGGRVLGPYLIVSLLIAITLIIGLRINTPTAIAVISKWFMAVMVWMKEAFVTVKTGIEKSPDILPESISNGQSDDKTESRDDKKQRKEKKTSARTSDVDNAAVAVTNDINTTDTVDAVDTVDTNDITDNSDTAADNVDDKDTAVIIINSDDEQNLETERDDFWKNRDAPIQILTIETPDIEPTDDEALIPILGNDGQEYDDVIEDIDPIDDPENYDGDNNDSDDDNDGFAVIDIPKSVKPYELPSPDVIQNPPPRSDKIDAETREMIERTSAVLERTLMDFKVEGKVTAASYGPVVTRYEIVLAPGVKVSKVTSLQDDLLMAVGAEAIRIQAPIPGKSAVGIELPNETRQNVHFKNILLSSEFKKNFVLPAIIGSNISGIPYVTDITKTPHLLVAGQTGSGKSVCMNSLICTMLMTKKPEELRLIMIDPKQVEFTSFENIPHLLAPVVTESKEAVKALQWGVMEMERRYKLLTSAGVRKLDDFNTKLGSGKLDNVLQEEDLKPLPLIVIIIDELADLMMTAPKDVEGLIARITQKARAAGIHMIVATQRPSVNVITGLIKANLPSRIAFRTVSSIDSRTILDQGGSEKLLGMGDMLFLRNGAQNVERFHGAFIPDEDVESIVAAIREQEVDLEKINSFHDVIEDPDDGDDNDGGDSGGPRDSLFAEAARVTVSIGQGSTSLLQRRMNIGFARAGRIMDQLEHAGIVGPSKGSKTREVLVRPEELEGML